MKMTVGSLPKRCDGPGIYLQAPCFWSWPLVEVWTANDQKVAVTFSSCETAMFLWKCFGAGWINPSTRCVLSRVGMSVAWSSTRTSSLMVLAKTWSPDPPGETEAPSMPELCCTQCGMPYRTSRCKLQHHGVHHTFEVGTCDTLFVQSQPILGHFGSLMQLEFPNQSPWSLQVAQPAKKAVINGTWNPYDSWPCKDEMMNMPLG